MRSPETLFQVSLSTIESMFAPAGRGFYIPPYQRHYSWGKDQIRRLVEDLSVGIQAWVEDPDAVTFLGSVILIKDELFDQVEPVIREHLPSEVLVVIDGQQRISTIAVLGVQLHAALRQLQRKIGRREYQGKDWLENKIQSVLHRLLPLFELDSGHGAQQYYPKVIRAYEDQWSRDSATAQYHSPIAAFLNHYLVHYRIENTNKAFRPLREDGDGNAAIRAVYKAFSGFLKPIKRGLTIDEEPLYGRETLLTDEDVQRRLFKDSLPSDLFVGIEEDGDLSKLVVETLHLLAFSEYLLSRCSVTMIRPMEERFAFDMFEALNTTGQQLTAYETFRPLVVKAETLSAYRNSGSHRCIKHIDSFVPLDWSYDKRRKVTDDLLLPFAFAESGKRLAKRLGMQRNWIRSSFESMENIDDKRSFVVELRNLVKFYEEAWHYSSSITEQTTISGLDPQEAKATLLCLDFLRKANHDISVGPLSRYYSEAINKQTDNAWLDFSKAVKAVTGFFALYRWAYETKGLPEIYMAIMQKGEPDRSVLPLARSLLHAQNAEIPSAESVAKLLGDRLLARLNGGKSEWVDRVKLKPISGTLARFCLSVAFHDTVEDPSALGSALPVRGRTGSLDVLNLRQWTQASDVEHIAPQTRSTAWDENLYAGDTLDLIGNLVLLPREINSSVGNRSWRHKKLYYKILSSPQRMDEFLDSEEVRELGLDLSGLSPSSMSLLAQAQYHAHLAPLANVDGDWDIDLVRKRSERLASLVWDWLAPWIGIVEV